jgi:hypothetical protein
MIEIKVLYNKLVNRNTTKIIMKYITKYYVRPLLALQKKLLKNTVIIKILDICKKPLLFIFKYENISIAITLYIFFYARVFIILSLGIDILYLHQITVFYKMLYLLIIPLAINSFLSILQEQSTTMLNDLEFKDVSLTHNNVYYEVKVKNPNRCFKTKAIILQKCKTNLEILSCITNINEIKNWYYFILFQCVLSIIFCSLWTYAILRMIYITEL